MTNMVNWLDARVAVGGGWCGLWVVREKAILCLSDGIDLP